jgi:poly(3-hydroxybutyrate) depolymerase
MPSFLAGKGKTHPSEQISLSGAAPVSSSSHADGVEDSATTQAARDRESPIPRMVGDGTRDSPIALLDDGDPKADSGDYQEVSAKRMKMANGEKVGLPGSTPVPTATPKTENGDNTRKRKHSNIAAEVRC